MASKTPKFSRLRRAILRGTSESFVWDLIRLSDSFHLSTKDKAFRLSVEYPLIALLLSMKREEISTAEHKSSKRTLDSKLVLMKDNCSQSYGSNHTIWWLSNQSVCNRVLSMIQVWLEVALELEIASNIAKQSLIGAIWARRRRENFWV